MSLLAKLNARAKERMEERQRPSTPTPVITAPGTGRIHIQPHRLGTSEPGPEKPPLKEQHPDRDNQVADQATVDARSDKTRRRAARDGEGGDDALATRALLRKKLRPAAADEASFMKNGANLKADLDEAEAGGSEEGRHNKVEVEGHEPDTNASAIKPSRRVKRVDPVKPPKVAALPWMRSPMTLHGSDSLPLGLVTGLDPRLVAVLQSQGMQRLFPVQVGVWRESRAGLAEGRDLCVCAPTGSGKTLAYALPIAHRLARRVVRRLRALVVLPTHDLAQQVAEVLLPVCAAVGLRVGLVAGKGSLHPEASTLVAHSGESLVDVLVATPGRLTAHMRQTAGFTLQHLKYLVVDETDRMLRQAYQNWLPQVLKAVEGEEGGDDEEGPGAAADELHAEDSHADETAEVAGRARHPTSGTECGSGWVVRTVRHDQWERGRRGRGPRLCKMLLSATLTQDPSKIARLALHAPRMLIVKGLPHPAAPTESMDEPADKAKNIPEVGNLEGEKQAELRYSLSEHLKSYKVECELATKPLVLLALLEDLANEASICFVASVEATHRLYLLLAAMEGLPFKVVEYSSYQTQAERSAALIAFKQCNELGGGVVMVASDAMTRGMDIKNVANVVNYDAPMYAKTYVHRVGRTARAGQSGRAFTLLRRQEARHFKRMLQKVENSKLKNYAMLESRCEALIPRYQAALTAVKRIVAATTSRGKQSQVAGATPAMRVARMQAASNFRALVSAAM